MTRSMKRLLLAAAAAIAIAAPAANAQIVRGDQLVAQSNYVSRQQATIPQVSIVVRADFVLFSVRYETGTRSADARENELAAVFKAVTDRAAKAEGMTIEVGQPGFSAAVETAAIKELIQQDGDDRSAIDVVLKVNVKDKETFDQVRARAEKFVKDTPLTGRAEAVIGDSQFLGVAEPKKHRETLIKAISEDVRLMQASFGGPNAPVQVSLTGMEQRVQTRPVGPLDLEIYVPYSMSLKSGAGN
ncbi:MAG: hypothetical protein EON61_21530 [Alphaproteobacteria bacterium]|jgi:hypothetical protein|nr:MAG: hypothetical protein EON61_21530 [Alphaproteobacteria bacterium]